MGKSHLRFSLRTFLIAVTLLSVIMGAFGNRYLRIRQQRVLITKLEALGAKVNFERNVLSESWSRFLTRHINGEENIYSCEFRTRVEDENDLQILTEIPGLQCLTFLDPPQSRAGVQLIAATPELRMVVFHAKEPLRNLHELRAAKYLTRCVLIGEDIDDQTIEDLSSVKQIQWLELIKCSLSNEGLASLVKMQELRSLGFFSINKQQEEAFVGIRNLEKLEYLEFVNATVSETESKALRNLKSLRKIRLVDVAINRYLLEDLAGLSNLNSLDIKAGEVQDIDLRILEKYPALETLEIYSPKLSDFGLTNLERLKRLRSVRIDSPAVTPQGLRRLSAALPEAKFDHRTSQIMNSDLAPH